MARPFIVNFPQADTQALLPTTVAGGAATSSIVLANPYPIEFPHISRPITMTSSDDLSGVNFTITGKNIYGTTISEVLAGPNNNTVTSVRNYHIISNISCDDAYTNFSIGWASTGVIQWIPLNYQIQPIAISIQAVVTGTINYSLYSTLDPISSYEPVAGWYKYQVPITSAYLSSNPLSVTNTSRVVTVTVPSTIGLQDNQLVTIAGATDTGGITAANLNITAAITVASATTFTYNAAAAASSTTTGGGSVVTYTTPPEPRRNEIVAALTGATTSQFYTSTSPVNAIGGTIASSSLGGSLVLTILQAGV